MFYMYTGLFSRRFFTGSVYSSVVPEFSFFSSFFGFPLLSSSLLVTQLPLSKDLGMLAKLTR